MGNGRGAITDVVEAAYAPAATDDEWATRVVDAYRAFLGPRDPLGLTALRHSADCREIEPLFYAGVPRDIGDAQDAAVRSAGIDDLRAAFYPRHVVSTHRELDPELTPDARELLAATRRAFGMTDCLGLCLHPVPGLACVVFAGAAAPIVLARHERRRLTQLALHVESALRMRLRPETVLAVLDPNGKIVHLEPDSPGRDALTTRVRHIEKARTRRERASDDALDPWPALVEGRASLVERTEGGRRFYFVLENTPRAAPLRALTRGEIDAVTHAARGLSSKLVGYALGVSPPTVSSRLASAATKIGVASRLELVRLAAVLTQDPRGSFEEIALTTAERDVLGLLSHGLSNEDIARIRNRSVRTIANQVARLLEKTRSPTRRALIAKARS